MPRSAAPFALASLALATALGGCEAVGAFECEHDSQCVRPRATGTCEPVGFCSFPDPACGSGRRYGELADDPWASACVVPPPDPPGDADTDEGAGIDGSDDASDGSTTWRVGAATGDGDTGESSAAASTDDGEASDDGEGESSTGAQKGCALEVIDDFDDGAIDRAWIVNEGWSGADVAESGGRLTVEIPPYVAPNTIVSRPLGASLAEGWVRLRLEEIDAPGSGASAGLVFAVPGCDFELYVEAGLARAFRYAEGEAPWPVQSIPLGDPLPRWLRLRLSADDTLHFEISVDAATWTEVASDQFPECGDLGVPTTIGVFAGGVASGVTRRFDEIAACVL